MDPARPEGVVPARPGDTGPGLPPQGVAEPDRDLASVQVRLAAQVAAVTGLPPVPADPGLLPDIGDSLRQVLRLCAEALGAERGVLLLHDEQAGELVPAATFGRTRADTVPVDGATALRQPQVVLDLAEGPGPAEHAWAAPLRACRAAVALPLLTGADELLGLIAVGCATAAPTDRAVLVAAGLARQTGEFVARARLHGQAARTADRERARNAQLRALAEVGTALTRARDLQELLELVTESARELVGCHQSVTSRLPHGWAQATTVVSLSDKYAAWRGYDVAPKGLGVLNAVTRENRPLRLTGQELVQHPDWRGLADAPGHPPLPDYLAAPLLARDGSNLGLVQLADKLDGEPFTAEDEAVVVQLAQVASAALETMEALEREQARARTAERTAQAAAALAEVTSPAELLDVLVRVAPPLLGASAAQVCLLDASGLVVAATSGPGVDLEVALARAVADRDVVVVASADEGARAFPGREDAPVPALVALPLVAAGEVLGAWAFTLPEPRTVGAEERLGLTALAGMAAQALDRTRRQQAEHEMAAALQRALLPPTLPAPPGLDVAVQYLPAAAGVLVGGDWYDVLAFPDGSVAVAVGDVQGHSSEAAAVMGQVRYALRAYAAEGHPPEQVVALTNRLLCDLDTGRFATCVYAVVAPSGSVRVVRAGHPLPVLVPLDAAPTLVDVPGGLPLGILRDEAYDVAELDLAPGAGLVLYTDGLVEPLRTLGQDEQVLLDALSGATGAADLVSRALSVAERVPGQPDDVAVLALRRAAGPS